MLSLPPSTFTDTLSGLIRVLDRRLNSGTQGRGVSHRFLLHEHASAEAKALVGSSALTPKIAWRSVIPLSHRVLLRPAGVRRGQRVHPTAAMPHCPLAPDGRGWLPLAPSSPPATA